MTIPTGIDTDAPVIARHEIDINAPLDTVWRTAPGPLRLAEPSRGQTRACLTVQARGPVVRQAQGAVADVRIRRW